MKCLDLHRKFLFQWTSSKFDLSNELNVTFFINAISIAFELLKFTLQIHVRRLKIITRKIDKHFDDFFVVHTNIIYRVLQPQYLSKMSFLSMHQLPWMYKLTSCLICCSVELRGTQYKKNVKMKNFCPWWATSCFNVNGILPVWNTYTRYLLILAKLCQIHSV